MTIDHDEDSEEDVHAVPLPRTGEGTSIPILEPVVAVEPIAGPPITEIPREFHLYPPSSPTTSLSVVSSELSVIFVRPVPPPLPGPSLSRSPETPPMSVTKSTPSSLTSSPHPSSPRAPPSPSIRECLWAPETYDANSNSSPPLHTLLRSRAD